MRLRRAEDGLERCSFCGLPLGVVDGTDPEKAKAAEKWGEVYECDDGHEGRYIHYRDPDRDDEFYGACKGYTEP